MDPLGIVKPEVVSEVVEEFLGPADRILVDLDELFREGALVAFDTAVDARAAGIAPVMGNVLGAEKGIAFTFELRSVGGLHLLDGQRVPVLQLFDEVPGVAAVQAGIGERERLFPPDIDGGVEVQPQLVQLPGHDIQLQVTPILGMRGIAYPHPGVASFAWVLGPFRVRVMVDPAASLEEQAMPLEDLADGRDGR